VPPRSACEGCGAWRVDAELANEAVAEAAPLAPGAKVTVKDTGWLGATVTGNERPLTENLRAWVPTKLTENADTLAPLASVCLPPVLTKTTPDVTGINIQYAATSRKPQMVPGAALDAGLTGSNRHKVRRTLNSLKGTFPSEMPPVRFWLLSFSEPVFTYSPIFLNHNGHDSSPAL
jgi:hypothetical protein